MIDQPRNVVAIPVQNEASHIEACLRALGGQDALILLLVNNTSDATVEVATATAASADLSIVVDQRTIPPDRASAGRARALAMDAALAIVAPGGTLFTTDADTRVAPDWIESNLRHIQRGCDAVAGRAIIDPLDAATLPSRLHEDDARECGLAALLDEVASRLDPDPADPWPRHTEHSGASICVTASAFVRAGGLPDMALGEDRALFAALRRVDAVIRHAPEVAVTVSGRLEGRARGGMADTMRRRLSAPDLFLDDAIEPVAHAERRFQLRARARRVWHGAVDATLARDLGLRASDLGRILRARHFGQAWDTLERRCPTLVRRRIPAAEVVAQTHEARALLGKLRSTATPNTDPFDMSRRAGMRSA